MQTHLNKDQEASYKAWRALGKFGSLGFMLAACIFTGLTTGHFLDQKLKTAPWLTITLMVLGIVAGFLYIFQNIMPKDK